MRANDLRLRRPMELKLSNYETKQMYSVIR